MFFVGASQESVLPTNFNFFGFKGDIISSAIESKISLSLPAYKTGEIIRIAIMKIKIVDTKDLNTLSFTPFITTPPCNELLRICQLWIIGYNLHQFDYFGKREIQEALNGGQKLSRERISVCTR